MLKKRRSIRLKEYDYSKEGMYFVTMCVFNRIALFGEIENGKMILNELGEIVEKCFNEIPCHFPYVRIDKYVVMPNHFHGIIKINGMPVGANNYSPEYDDKLNNIINDFENGAKDISPLQINNKCSSNKIYGTSKTIGSIIRGFKIGVTKWVRKNTNIKNVWQRNYYEHIIREELDLYRIYEYIDNNVLNWDTDKYFI